MIATDRYAGYRARTLFAVAALAAAAANANARAQSQPAPVAVAVMPLDYVDTSGEVGDQRQAHEDRLQRFTASFRADLAGSGRYRVVDPACGSAPCAVAAEDAAALIDDARRAGATLLIFGGVHKMSTLVQWAKLQAVDVQTNKLVFDKLITFRGDTDEAWNRAESFAVQEVMALPPAP